jgi:heme/copper-type cytochrome/quinol oxidase subunit 2
MVIDPGETKTMRATLKKAGVFPFYCTNFCSALHQEMQGYLVVKPPAGGPAPTAAATGTQPAPQ